MQLCSHREVNICKIGQINAKEIAELLSVMESSRRVSTKHEAVLHATKSLLISIKKVNLTIKTSTMESSTVDEFINKHRRLFVYPFPAAHQTNIETGKICGKKSNQRLLILLFAPNEAKTTPYNKKFTKKNYSFALKIAKRRGSLSLPAHQLHTSTGQCR